MQDRYLNKVKSISRGLTKPDFFCNARGVSFSAYKAKDLHNSRWLDKKLRKILLILRRSYYRYGKRPLIDRYDGKSAIYLVRAKKGAYEEWLSFRFTPNDGKPLGGGEIEIYYSNGRSLSVIARKKLFGGRKSFWKHIVSTSRMCGVPLYTRHKYTAICFAIISYTFMLDSFKRKLPFKYATGIISKKLIADALTIKKGGIKISPHFTQSYKTLHIGKNSIKIDRNIYTYKFPSYFLDKAQLLSLLRKIVKEKALPKSTLNLRRLGDFISKNGKIKGVDLTREKLRAVIDKNVADGPELKLTKISDWNRSILKLIKAAGLKCVSMRI